MQRYLNINNSAYVIIIVFLIILFIGNADNMVSYFAMSIFLFFIPWNIIVSAIEREPVKESLHIREPYQVLADRLFSEIGTFEKNNDKDRPCVMFVYDDGETPHEEIYHFMYLLWPDFDMPWECMYGSSLAFDGDSYTQILSKEGFSKHVEDIGADYIAIGLPDDDFIRTYGSLFDSEIEAGQVYKVDDNEMYHLLK